MPRRIKSNTSFYHVYSRGNNKVEIFRNINDVIKFNYIINDSLSKFNYKIHSFCIMTNHYHLLIEDCNSEISNIMHLINLRYAKYFNHNNQRTGKLFEREFQSKPIETDAYFLRLIAYIHNNWSKTNHSDNQFDFRVCSYLSYLGTKSLLNNFTTEKTFGLLKNNIDKFKELHIHNDEHFDPLIKSAEKVFTINETIEKSNLNLQTKRDILIYFMKSNTSNSSIEIASWLKHPSIDALRSKIKRVVAKKEIYEDYLKERNVLN